MTPFGSTETPPQESEQSADADEGPGEPAEPCAVELSLETDDLDPPLTGWLDDHVACIAQLAAAPGGRIGLAVVDDERMARLHEQYKNVAGTTDVLTFDLREDGDATLDADIVICRDEAVRQATARGREARLELLLYAVHGLLHLLGYDDVDDDQAAVMHARENDLLTAAGFGPLYG